MIMGAIVFVVVCMYGPFMTVFMDMIMRVIVIILLSILMVMLVQMFQIMVMIIFMVVNFKFIGVSASTCFAHNIWFNRFVFYQQICIIIVYSDKV